MLDSERVERSRKIVTLVFTLGVFLGGIAVVAGLVLGLIIGTWTVLWVGLAVIALTVAIMVLWAFAMWANVRMAGNAVKRELIEEARLRAEAKAEIAALRAELGDDDAVLLEYARRHAKDRIRPT
jgi:type VI protein secretion system component VasK